MQLFEKIKESVISVLPIMALGVLLHLSIAPMGAALAPFLVGGALVIAGLGIFLHGTELGMVPIGQKAGAAITSKKNVLLLLVSAFLIGFLITIAEPDVHVLAQQVTSVSPSITSSTLVFMIALGVGLFVLVAVGRILLDFSYKLALTAFYILLFVCAAFTSGDFVGIAFDAGGATTGPMTVPFIMALGIGVASVRGGRKAEQDSFGFIGLASIGPIMAVVLLGMLGQNASAQSQEAAADASLQTLSLLETFLGRVPSVVHEVSMALAPLLAMFIVFQLFLIKMPRRQVIRMSAGLVYTYIGLILFFVGVQGGFMPAGRILGASLAGFGSEGIIILTGLVLGAVVVCAEPAVWVLNEQIEEVSGGHIKKRIMLFSLSSGVAVAVALSMARVVFGISLWWLLIPGYTLALGLTRFCPQMFTAIAFDSGGVASGPMASTFILAFTLGASQALGGNPITDAFGVIAMIAMMPLITIQVLGILFHRKERRLLAQKRAARREERAHG
ncbi:MAG TPA: DUF1538 domain-containing protein [Candidatus Desulfovibrio intestinipullorum]|uniref:DUF1538 domain-containing protein n=1 Tax=Candidatus Desulfovibrio intestinipullorum TaxID=2838536 RepID=A0A9D1PVR8_9BACT|nr:DUF1538 domain-containing protein [Candidatus Desulfovibrio intestinipullorum]